MIFVILESNMYLYEINKLQASLVFQESVVLGEKGILLDFSLLYLAIYVH